jgi:hypothetical protein
MSMNGNSGNKTQIPQGVIYIKPVTRKRMSTLQQWQKTGAKTFCKNKKM